MDCIAPFIMFAAMIAVIIYVIKRFGKDESRNKATRMHATSHTEDNDDGMMRMARGMIMLDLLEYGIPPWNVGDNDEDPYDENPYDTGIDYDDDDYDDSDYEGYDD